MTASLQTNNGFITSEMAEAYAAAVASVRNATPEQKAVARKKAFALPMYQDEEMQKAHEDAVRAVAAEKVSPYAEVRRRNLLRWLP